MLQFVPLLVEVCIRIIEEKGMENKGIYRVPGNTAAIASLQADVEKVVCAHFVAEQLTLRFMRYTIAR